MFASVLTSLALLAASVQAAPISSEATLAKIAVSLALPSTNQTNAVEWYAQNGNAGACGIYSKDTDFVVGLPTEFYYDLDSVSTYCGAYVVINSVLTGKNVTARVEDASAANETLSVSLAVWAALEGDDTELTEVTWVFANATEIAAATGSSSSSAARTSTTSVAKSSATQAAKSSTTQAYSQAKSSTTEAYYSPAKASTTTTSSPAYKATTTTQAYVAPSSSAKAYTTSYKPSTTTYKTTTTTTTTQAAASTTAAKKTTTYSSSSSSSYTGYATFFTQGGVAGACGTVHSDSDYIVALQTSMYNSGARCGDSLTATYNGKSVTVTVADECPTCDSTTSIDLSVAAFTALASEDVGEMTVSWSFN